MTASWTSHAKLVFPTRPGPIPPAQGRISYCISSWPCDVISGGGVFARGESDQELVILKVPHSWHGDVTLQRDDAMLVVNGRRLQRGATYCALRVFPLTNPWLLLKAKWRIRNAGHGESWHSP